MPVDAGAGRWLKALAGRDRRAAQRAAAALAAGADRRVVPAVLGLTKRPAALELLGNLAAGGDHLDKIPNGADARDPLTAAVAKGIAKITAALEGKDADVRASAAFALAFLPGAAERSLVLLRRRLLAEEDRNARASVLYAMAVLGRGEDPADAAALTAALRDKDPAARLAGALGAYLRGRLSGPARDVLLDAVAHKPGPGPWGHGRPAGIADRVILDAVHRYGDLDLAARRLRAAGGDAQAAALLALGAAYPSPITMSTLSPAQREFLLHLARDEALYLHCAGERHDLPRTPRDLRQALGVKAPATLLDTPLVVGGVRTKLRDAFDLALEQRRLRPQLAQALADGRTPDKILALVTATSDPRGDGRLPPDGSPYARTVAAVFEAAGGGILPLLRTCQGPPPLRLGAALALSRLQGGEATPADLTPLFEDLDVLPWSEPIVREILVPLDIASRAALLAPLLGRGSVFNLLPLAPHPALLSHVLKDVTTWGANKETIEEEIWRAWPDKVLGPFIEGLRDGGFDKEADRVETAISRYL